MYLAGDIMTKDLVFVGPDWSVREAIGLFVEHDVSGMPVIDRHSVLRGVVTEFRLLEVLFNPQLRHCCVYDVMTHDVITVAPDTLLSDVAAILLQHRIKRLPVVENGKVVGIVSRCDLLRYVNEVGPQLDRLVAELDHFATSE